jgi:two-component sensor histidine kinase
LWLRYLATTVVMAACAAVQFWLSTYSNFPALSVLLTGIFLCSVAFDRGTGFYASLIGAASTYQVLMQVAWKGPALPAVAIFFLVGCGLSLIAEGLRAALDRARAAERANALLYRELSHRTQNNLAIAASILLLQARDQTDPGARAALDTAQKRLMVMGELQRHLEKVGSDRVSVPDYLAELCSYMRKSIAGTKAVDLRVDAAPMILSGDKVVPVGLIVNELVTNALKYAFTHKEDGAVIITLARKDTGELELSVSDNGQGYAGSTVQGLGSRLVRLLAKQLNGAAAWENTSPGCRVRVTFPER